MDDEEDEQLPHCCETPLRNKSSENRDGPRVEVGQTANRHGRFEDRSTQTARTVLNSARDRDMAPFQGLARDASSPCRSVDARTAFGANCGTGGLASLTIAPGAPEGPRALFHGNAGFRSHFPALFEPVPDGTQNTEEDEGRPEEKEDERDVGISVEIQIGRKLREMGDQFQLEHLQLVRVISDETRPILWFSLQWFLSRCAMTSSSVISMLHMQMLIGRDDIIFGLPELYGVFVVVKN
uniref:BCL2 modifying factor 2 n=1 Tax=Cyprinus carpio TaxID=7962 RepID=A0A8C2BTF4_CYPCA